ncbi:Maf family protein [Hyphococcus sp.]|uniref:Maf family protein n=1 Tax=Hyphococcus sp. TaxID=2038636 RepID=UPI003CCB8381
MTQNADIILASGSAIRRQILQAVGVLFNVVRPDVDEGKIKEEALERGEDLNELAMMLAEAKCLNVSAQRARSAGALVIGADQIMEFDGRAYDKPADMDQARSRLRALQGKSHTLINAVAVARKGEIIWRNLDRPKLFMRAMTEKEIDAYLEAAGADILSSVGAYQVEKLGARLFDRIEGDYFAILGLSLFPLLAFLRREGALVY